MRKCLLIVCVFVSLCLPALATQPVVAIHVSELTQSLESMVATPPTPTEWGTTGYQWWTPTWHYLVMPESMKEALQSDGTPYVVVSDADISAGKLLAPDGSPNYPIVISLASEAIRDNEITPLIDYVSAGGYLLIGSSSFTRNPDGTTRGDFALASSIGMHMANSNLQNWIETKTITVVSPHRLVSHLPSGTLNWQMPRYSEDGNLYYQQTWQTSPGDARVIVTTDGGAPMISVRGYGKGYFIYYAAMQPMMAYTGWGPGMYAYGILRNAIQWAFETADLPIVKVSPWPYPYNAAYLVRHDFENYQDMISSIESSAQAENAVGAKGDYYFCTGTLRVEMNNSPTVIASLRRAVSQYGATIGSHNGGLPNPNYPGEPISSYSYWHWGPDEVLDDTISGYTSGAAYATTSIGMSFSDIDGWMAGLNTNTRTWSSPWFNAIREQSLQVLQQVGAQTAGEQKITPFPHWTLSTETPGTRYNFVSLPTSDWYIGSDVAQSLESHTGTSTIYALIDYYYSIGALINLYSHSSSIGGLPYDYLQYSSAKNAIWPTNASSIYTWWKNRSPVQVMPTYTIIGNRLVVTATVSGAVDPQTAIELAIPNWLIASTGIQVRVNGAFADPSSYRIYNQGIKILVGTSTSTVEVSYPLTTGPTAADDSYSVISGSALVVAAPGVLANDTNPAGGSLTAVLTAQPAHGTLSFSADGSFTYTPSAGFIGTDVFGYYATDGTYESRVASVTINVQSAFPPPAALNDDYSVAQNTTLNVPAPGVLGNDSSNGNGSLSAALVSPSLHGTVSLNSDGSFTYVPSAGFSGIDTFTYQAFAAGLGSNTATVAITVTTSGSTILFSDDFSGPSGPDPLWVVVAGTWNVANGVMLGASPTGSYGYAYASGSWTNYTLQGQVQFPAGTYGGGLGGYLNSGTGAHYAAWIYPEGTPGGSATLRLIKFQDWTTWSTLSQASLPAVGTGPHTIQMTFQSNSIQVSVDGIQYASATDNSSPYVSGGVSLEMWTSSSPYTLTFDNILVQSVSSTPVAQNDSYQTAQNTTLNVSSPGVLGNDTGGSGATAILVSTTSNGMLALHSDGSFSYTPSASFVGTDTFTYQENFGGQVSNVATVTLTVSPLGVSSVVLSPASVTGGASSSGTVTLSAPAPTGGAVVTLISSNTAVVTVPGSVSIAANAATATFTVTSMPVASTASVNVSATYNSTTQAAVMTVTPPALSGVGVSPTSVRGGNYSTGTVTLNGPAPSGGAVVMLTSDNTSVATMPPSVTVAANSMTATFTVTTNPVSSNTSVTISGTYNSTTQNATLTVTPVPATLSSVTLNPISVVGGNSSIGTVTLSGPAPSGGAVVTLTSSNTSVATVPATFTVAANATTATFAVTTLPVASNTSVTISAIYNSTTQTAGLTVAPPILNRLTLSPSSVTGGNSSTGTVTLSGPAPPGGAVVTLTSSNTSVATVPASVTVAANATTATFAVTTLPVASNTSVTISAIYNSTTQTAGLTVTPPILNSLTLSPSSVTGGNSSTGTVTLSRPAPSVGAVVTLTSSNTSVATVPASVTVAANATTATFTVTTLPVANNTSVTISGTYNTLTRNATLTVNTVAINSVTLTPSSVTGGNSSTGTVTLSRSAPAGGTVVVLTSNNTGVAVVPASVTVAANATTAKFTVTTNPVATNTAVTISATYNAVTRNATLTVTAPLLNSISLNPTSVTGGSPSSGTVTLTGAAPAAGVLVTLSSSNTSRATVPANVTVGAGATTATFTVTTIPVSSSGSVGIYASYGNRTRSASLTVNTPRVSALSLSPTTVQGGTPSTGTVILNGPAPTGGASVTLSSSSTAVATVPSSITVAAGSTTATFTVTTSTVTSGRTVTISARRGVTISASLTVTP